MKNNAERFVETFEERLEDGKSRLYYQALDNKMHKVGDSDLAELDAKINGEFASLKKDIEKVVNAIKAASFEGSSVPSLSWVDTTYSITYSLGTHLTSSNPVVRVSKGGSYETTITAGEGYEIDTVAITIGGQSVQDQGTDVEGGKKFYFSNINGNIVITVTEAAASSGQEES